MLQATSSVNAMIIAPEITESVLHPLTVKTVATDTVETAKAETEKVANLRYFNGLFDAQKGANKVVKEYRRTLISALSDMETLFHINQLMKDAVLTLCEFADITTAQFFEYNFQKKLYTYKECLIDGVHYAVRRYKITDRYLDNGMFETVTINEQTYGFKPITNFTPWGVLSHIREMGTSRFKEMVKKINADKAAKNREKKAKAKAETAKAETAKAETETAKAEKPKAKAAKKAA